MALLDLLGRRWALRILWELKNGPLTFRALQENCDQVSPTVLNLRLRELRDSHFVSQSDESGYQLTRLGRELGEQFVPLAHWAERWARIARKK